MFNSIKLQKVKDLIHTARVHSSKALPAETHQSFPIPLKGEKPLGVAFLYCISRVTPKEGILLLPPNHRALINAGTGELVNFVQTSPADFELKHPENELLGKYVMPHGVTADEFVALKEKLFQLYDILMPLFADGQTRVSAIMQKAAEEFHSLFFRVAEVPLFPYYKYLGRDFFDWLEKIAKI